MIKSRRIKITLERDYESEEMVFFFSDMDIKDRPQDYNKISGTGCKLSRETILAYAPNINHIMKFVFGRSALEKPICVEIKEIEEFD